MLLVHVTPFNALMWDSGHVPTRVIEHGVRLLRDAATAASSTRRGRRQQPGRRGRRLGADVYARVACEVPLALIGMGAERCGGLGEIGQLDLPAFIARHRFFFNPIRYTSLGLAIIEAMMVGLPIVGLATTELATVIRNGDNGIVDTRLDRLVEAMQQLTGRSRAGPPARRRRAPHRAGALRHRALRGRLARRTGIGRGLNGAAS